MASTVVWLLGLAVVAQFMIIMHLMHTGHTLQSSLSCNQKLSALAVVAAPAAAVKAPPTPSPTPSPTPAKPKGVAATLLLHAPKVRGHVMCMSPSPM